MNTFALVDCNNFYASCERLFKPSLTNRPIIVLSNNDGCVVARSQEAKQLGILMGEPYFKIKDLCNKLKITVCSSNYPLYGDLSRRVMSILADMAPDIQVYSIDEAFLHYPSHISTEKVYADCREIRSTVKQWVGIPTSIGIGPTKTLAKVANHLAKKNKVEGICDLTSPTTLQTILQTFPIGDVWGIGSRSQIKLKALGIYTAWQFREMDPSVIRRQMGVVGERILWELRGVSCMPLEEAQPKKNIAFSRSFGKSVTQLEELHEAISVYTAQACIKLRKQNSCAQAACIYLEGAFKAEGGPRQHYSQLISFRHPLNDTPTLISHAKRCINYLFCSGQRYKKCGIILLDLIAEDRVIPDLFGNGLNPKRRKLAETIDALNRRKKNTIFYGAMGISKSSTWQTQSQRRSPRYTTCWKELATVRA